jgi:hypothetical protein
MRNVLGKVGEVALVENRLHYDRAASVKAQRNASTWY